MADNCECGQRLPTHLINVMADVSPFRHICSCDRLYQIKNKEFVCIGTQHNPIAEFDRLNAIPMAPIDLGYSHNQEHINAVQGALDGLAKPSNMYLRCTPQHGGCDKKEGHKGQHQVFVTK